MCEFEHEAEAIMASHEEMCRDLQLKITSFFSESLVSFSSITMQYILCNHCYSFQ
jgi:hypothetical protein